MNELVQVFEEETDFFEADTSEEGLHPLTRFKMWLEDKRRDGWRPLKITTEEDYTEPETVQYFFTVVSERRVG